MPYDLFYYHFFFFFLMIFWKMKHLILWIYKGLLIFNQQNFICDKSHEGSFLNPCEWRLHINLQDSIRIFPFLFNDQFWNQFTKIVLRNPFHLNYLIFFLKLPCVFLLEWANITSQLIKVEVYSFLMIQEIHSNLKESMNWNLYWIYRIIFEQTNRKRILWNQDYLNMRRNAEFV